MMNNESFITSHSRCPQCAKLGKDNGHDNLGLYSDGHQYCFSCGYYLPGNTTATYYRKHSGVQESVQQAWNGLQLPFDCTPELSQQATQWIKQYNIPPATLTKHNLLWSESRQFLVFPYFIEGELIGWQGRYFGKDPIGKWHTKGKPETFIYTIGQNNDSLVLVEDVVSAIKVSRYMQASPIFGSVISNQRFIRLARSYDTTIIWLDPDKQKDALKFAQKGRMFGLNCQVIISDKDPKEHSYEEIESYLNDKTRSSPTEHPPSS